MNEIHQLFDFLLPEFRGSTNLIAYSFIFSLPHSANVKSAVSERCFSRFAIALPVLRSKVKADFSTNPPQYQHDLLLSNFSQLPLSLLLIGL